MAVYQQGGFWYFDFVWMEGGKKRRIRRKAKDEKQRPVTSQTGAEAAENRARAKLAAGTFDPEQTPTDLTTGEFWEKHYTPKHVARSEQSSQSSTDTIWRVSLQPVVGDVPLRSVGAEHYAAVATGMRVKGRKPKTINNALSALHTALDLGREWKLRGPVEPVKWEKVPEAEIEAFVEADMDRLAAVGDPMVTFALKTGMRLGELLALQRPYVDLRGARVTVCRSVFWKAEKAYEKATKSGRIRVLPLPPSAVAAVKALEVRGEYVFTSPEGKQLTKNGTRRRLWNACKKAGLPRCGWHKLRHSYISLLVAKGVPLPQVQQLAGHARIEVTMRYVHVHQDHLRAAISLIG